MAELAGRTARYRTDKILSKAEPFAAPAVVISNNSRRAHLRACFLAQNVCALGYGVAMVQTPAVMVEQPANDSLAPKDVLPSGGAPLPNRMLAEFRRHAPHYS